MRSGAADIAGMSAANIDGMRVAEEILAIFQARGSEAYFGENVSTTEHCLQAANFAKLAAAPPELIVAALLHDIGHLVDDDVAGDIAKWTVDARHEQIGGRWLAARFGPEVSEPVRLHVPAKRYLLATDAGYFAKLSPASVLTLKLQGGPMAAHEVVEFETEPFYREAVRVRQWDDQGKVAGLETPGLHDYRSLLQELATDTAR
jgi:phosphonate degradation associated HDIG domain protein